MNRIGRRRRHRCLEALRYVVRLRERREWLTPIEGLDLGTTDRLTVEKCLRDRLQQITVLGQNVVRGRVRLVEDPLDLLIHHPVRVLAHRAALLDLPAEEHLLLIVPHGHQPDHLAHPEGRDHPARHLRGALDVVARAGRDVVVRLLIRLHSAQLRQKTIAVSAIRSLLSPVKSHRFSFLRWYQKSTSILLGRS